MADLDDLSIYDMFRMEAEEQTEQLQRRLLALQSGDGGADNLRALMRGAHSLKGAARIVGLTGAVRLTHSMEDRFVAAQEGRAIEVGEIDVLLRAVDLLRSLGGVSEAESAEWMRAQDPAIQQLTEKLAEETTSTAAASPGAAPVGSAAPAPSPEPAKVSDDSAARISGGQPAMAAGEVGASEARVAEFNLRITSQRFDRIIAMASESLVHAQGMIRLSEQMQRTESRLEVAISALKEMVEERGRGGDGDDRREDVAEVLGKAETERTAMAGLLHDLDNAARVYERSAGKMHREVLYARLRPFGDILPGLQRLVRDTAAEMGKRVRMEVTGERTEVDRDILERLRAPLEHLLRNALDHGLEPPGERRERGKPEEGLIRLWARHENGRFAITLRDDGRGVDVAAVRERAQSRGLVQSSVAGKLSEAETLEFLFLPGFSTREAVTEISGRGFGLDVVQSIVHESGGAVRIENSVGAGTSFHLVLPVTRSLMRVMLVEAEEQVYAVPMNRLSRVANRSIRSDKDDAVWAEADGRRSPVLPLMDALGGAESPLEPGAATVLFFVDGKGSETDIAFKVDRMIGDTTVAVRQLDGRLGKMAGIAAVTLNEGNVPMLIIDPDDVLRAATKRRRTGRRQDRESCGSVLVVDDSQTLRQMLRRTLVSARYRVAVAEHGVEAWNLLQVESFDLLISDVDMPEMNGIELVEKVRANSRLNHLPIVLLSYKGREEDRRRGLEAGADAYVTKGEFQEDAFLQVVTDLIGPAEMEGVDA